MNKVLEFFIKAKDQSSAVIGKIISKIQSWRDEATKAAKATSEASKSSATSMEAVNEAMKKTSVNWDAIAKQEEAEKRRKAEIIALEAELKNAMTEAATATGEAADMAAQRVKMLKEGIHQLQQDASGDMNLIGAGMNLLNGNIIGFGKNLLETAKRAGILKKDLIGLSVYGLAIAAVVKIFTWWRDSIKECDEKIRSIKMDGLKTQLGQIEKMWKIINERLTETIEKTDIATNHAKALAEAAVEKKIQRNNQKREAELAGTDDATERERINRKYDQMNDILGIETRKKNFQRELDAEKTKLLRVEETIAKNEKLQIEAISKRNKETKELNALAGDKESDDYKAANDRVKEAQAKVNEYADKIKAMQKQADAIRRGITEKTAANDATLEGDKADAAKKAREAADAEKAVAEAKRKEQEKVADELDTVWRDWYNASAEYEKNKNSEIAKEKANLLAEYYDALAAAQDEAEREEIRAEYARQTRELQFLKQFEDERLAKEKETEKKRSEAEKANKKAQLAQDIKDTKARLAASTEAQQAAQARVSAAQAAVSQAWGWYRNKDSMKAYRDEQDANLEAQKQYQQDYKTLTRGRNADKFAEALYLSRRGDTDKLEEQMSKWRKGAFGLSVEDEATMRVAIAKDEEKRANQALQDISENTAAIGEILKVLQGGGEQE